MSTHASDPYTLQLLARLRRDEALRDAEQRRLRQSGAPATKVRATAAATLRGLADRVAPASQEAPATGGC